MHERYRMSRQALYGALAGGAAALLVCTAVWLFLVHQTPAAPSHKATAAITPAKPAAPAAPIPTMLQSHILFVGDMFWGRATNRRAMASPLKEAYPFSRLNEFGRDQYDAWIANLECPSVPGVQQPYDLEVDRLLFNCPTGYVPEMAKWFTAVSLANERSRSISEVVN